MKLWLVLISNLFFLHAYYFIKSLPYIWLPIVDAKCYLRMDDVTMGCPVFPIVAEILWKAGEKALNTAPIYPMLYHTSGMWIIPSQLCQIKKSKLLVSILIPS